MICHWEPFYTIMIQEVDSVPTIFANRDGLVSLAIQWADLAGADAPVGAHFHYDDSADLELGSIDLTLGQLDCSCAVGGLAEQTLDGADGCALGRISPLCLVPEARLEVRMLYGGLVVGTDPPGVSYVCNALLALAEEGVPGSGRLFSSVDNEGSIIGRFAVVFWPFDEDTRREAIEA